MGGRGRGSYLTKGMGGEGSLWGPWKEPPVGQGPQEPRFISRCEREKRKHPGWGVGLREQG